jgi:hypothetical protein
VDALLVEVGVSRYATLETPPFMLTSLTVNSVTKGAPFASVSSMVHSSDLLQRDLTNFAQAAKKEDENASFRNPQLPKSKDQS